MNCICIGNKERTALPDNALILLRYVTMSLALCPEPVCFYTSCQNFFEQIAHTLLRELAMEFLPFDYNSLYDSADRTIFNQSEVILCYATEEEAEFYSMLSKWEEEGKVVINLANNAKSTLHEFIAKRFVNLPLNNSMKLDFLT